MEFRVQKVDPGQVDAFPADALVVVLNGAASTGLDRSLSIAVDAAVADGDFVPCSGKFAYIGRAAGIQAPRVAVVSATDDSPKALKAAATAALAALKERRIDHLAVCFAGYPLLVRGHSEALALAVGDALYLYRYTKPTAAADARLARVTLLVNSGTDVHELGAGFSQGSAIVKGAVLARELVNRPANHCTPKILAEEAAKLAREHEMRIEVMDREAIEQIGMGAFLAVSQGSAEEPRFIVIHYDGAVNGVAPFVLVGKGVTFDTGGISLKVSAEMDLAKFDMAGAASILGALRAVAELKATVNVIGLIGTCENMPGGGAVKPGDVVTSLSGQTVEILDTGAEGRLILCDALTYAGRFNPAAVIDVATLTGACVVALGGVRSGLFSNDSALAEALLKAGDAALDPCWRMPLDDDYDEGLKTHFADVANLAGRGAGAVTAAMFLKRFVGDLRWAHLDVAGTAHKSGPAKGATGRPVGLLTHFLLSGFA